MPKDTLQQVWVKSLGNIITAVVADTSGTVWVGDTGGNLTRFTGDGVASEPIKLDNPIYSITVDKGTNDIYVGDASNTVSKYTSSGTLKWRKNLGEGTTADIPIVSTINSTKPDDNGNIDLSSIYFSKQEMEEMLAPLGKTKTVNGVQPDQSGNVTIDMSSYYAFKGVIDDKKNLDDVSETGWYIQHTKSGANNTLLVFATSDYTMQIMYGSEGSIKQRTRTSSAFSEWKIITNNVKSINNITPDANGNVEIDLTGNIKTVNNIKPDKDGNIQLGVGGKNTIKSVNTVNKPDDTGNVTVPTFAPNLLSGTTNKKQKIPVNAAAKPDNLWKNSVLDKGIAVKGDFDKPNDGTLASTLTKVQSGKSYTYSIYVNPTLKANDLSMVGISTKYNEWRKSTVTVTLHFYNANGVMLDMSKTKTFTFQQQTSSELVNISDTFTVPANATSVAIWYNGLEVTSENLVIGEAATKNAAAHHTCTDDQVVEFPKMMLSQDITNKRVVVKLQVRVSNFKSGNFFALKSKNANGNAFVLDDSKLDSYKTLIPPISSLDNDSLITGNGFYSWEYVILGSDLIGTDKNYIIPTTNVVGNFDYTIKICNWESNDEKPDMEWVPAPYTDANGVSKYPVTAYTEVRLWGGNLYSNDAVNVVNLGSYNVGNDYIALSDTEGMYSASASVDMQTSEGYCKLVLSKVDSKGTVIDSSVSDVLPIVTVDGNNIISDKSSVLKTDKVTNNSPKATDVIKLDLYLYGQTAEVSISQPKIAQWKDDGLTPPDLTWFPSAEDVLGGIKKINNALPDKDGNFNLPSLDNADFNYVSGQTIDFDKVKQSGIYNIMDATIACSTNPSALNNVPRNSDGKTICAYLIVNAHDKWNLEQTLIVFTGVNNPDLTICTRSIGGVNDQYRPPFRRLLYSDDLDKLNNTIATLGQIKTINGEKPFVDGNFKLRSFANPQYSYLAPYTLDVDTATDLGYYSIRGAKLSASILSRGIDDIVADIGSNVIDNGTMVVYKMLGVSQLAQILIIYNKNNVSTFGKSEVLIYVRQINPKDTTSMAPFKRVLLINDLNNLTGKIASMNNSITANKQDVDSFKQQAYNQIMSVHNDLESTKANLRDFKNQVNVQYLKAWNGTYSEYREIQQYDPMTMYFIVSDYEVLT